MKGQSEGSSGGHKGGWSGVRSSGGHNGVVRGQE